MSFIFFKLLVFFSAFFFSKLSFSFVLPDPKNLMIHLDFENNLMDRSGNDNHGEIDGQDSIVYK